MHYNPDHALGEIKAIRPSVRRPEAKVDLHDIFWELAYKVRMEKRSSLFTAASCSDGSVDSAQRKLGFESDAAEKVLIDRGDEELRSSPFVPPPDEAPFARPGPGERDTSSEDEVADGVGEVYKVWREMKVGKYGPGGGVALRGGSFLPV